MRKRGRDVVTINVGALVQLVDDVGKAARRGGPAAEVARVKVRHALADRLPSLAHTAQVAEAALTGPDPEAAAAYLALTIERLAEVAADLTRIEVRP